MIGGEGGGGGYFRACSNVWRGPSSWAPSWCVFVCGGGVGGGAIEITIGRYTFVPAYLVSSPCWTLPACPFGACPLGCCPSCCPPSLSPPSPSLSLPLPPLSLPPWGRAKSWAPPRRLALFLMMSTLACVSTLVPPTSSTQGSAQYLQRRLKLQLKPYQMHALYHHLEVGQGGGCTALVSHAVPLVMPIVMLMSPDVLPVLPDNSVIHVILWINPMCRRKTTLAPAGTCGLRSRCYTHR